MEFNTEHFINRVYLALLQNLGAMQRYWEDRTQQDGLDEVDGALFLSSTAAIIYEIRKLGGHLEIIEMKLNELLKDSAKHTEEQN